MLYSLFEALTLSLPLFLCQLVRFFSRGGVEDTRLEAKAKDTKKAESKAKDSPSEDRTSRSQGQECSRPRPRTKDTRASVFQKKKERSSNFFSDDLQNKKKVFKIFFLALSSKKRLPNFFFRRSAKFQQLKKKCCPRAEDRPVFEDLRPRGQGLDLRGKGQGQGLQNVSSRTPPLFFNYLGNHNKIIHYIWPNNYYKFTTAIYRKRL